MVKKKITSPIEEPRGLVISLFIVENPMGNCEFA